jgi:hypothetical protein
MKRPYLVQSKSIQQEGLFGCLSKMKLEVVERWWSVALTACCKNPLPVPVGGQVVNRLCVWVTDAMQSLTVLCRHFSGSEGVQSVEICALPVSILLSRPSASATKSYQGR